MTVAELRKALAKCDGDMLVVTYDACTSGDGSGCYAMLDDADRAKVVRCRENEHGFWEEWLCEDEGQDVFVVSC